MTHRGNEELLRHNRCWEIPALAATICLCFSTTCGPSAAQVREATQQASERMHSAQDAGHLQALLDSTDQAVSVGKEQVFHALVAFDLQGEGAFLAMCRGFVEREQFADALDCLEQARWQSMDTLALGLVHADALMGPSHGRSAPGDGV